MINGASESTAHGAETNFHFTLFIINLFCSVPVSEHMYIASASAAEVVEVKALLMSSLREAFISSGTWSREERGKRLATNDFTGLSLQKKKQYDIYSALQKFCCLLIVCEVCERSEVE